MHLFKIGGIQSMNKGRLDRNVGFFLFCVVMCLGAIIASFVQMPQAKAAETPLQREYLKKLDGPVLLRGDYFKAVMSAFADFESELSKNGRAATAPDTPNPSLALWLSKMENYDIHVSQNAGRIIVQFNPTVRGNFMPVLGGGARYEIDKQSFEVLSKTFSK
jgi:hypothetical protein